MDEIKAIIKEAWDSREYKKLRAAFAFTVDEPDEVIWYKFRYYSAYFHPQYFKTEDAPFHKEMDLNGIKIYKGELDQFVNAGFKGCAKTSRQKLLVAFCIANDREHFRRYIKVLSADPDNAIQITTDVFNMLTAPRHANVYPDIFEKTGAKREERMASFTTTTKIKMVADSIGTSQRGAIQEDARPDWLWFEDFENRKTLRSQRTTQSIWDNMEEARTGLAKGGSSLYTCNYISEMGNVHRLMSPTEGKVISIIPIMNTDGTIAWNRYTLGEIERMKAVDEDFQGERMCKPNASKDVYFDRESLERMVKILPVKEIGGLKIFKEFNPAHRYAGGHDVAGGVGLDSSTSVILDFQVIPVQVAATYNNNTIKPGDFGDEIHRESNIFGGCLVCPENNNTGDTTLFRLEQLGANLHMEYDEKGKVKTKGWNTNKVSKIKMLTDLQKAIADGHICLNDPDLIRECMSYSRNDLIDMVNDPRNTTRHFDLVMALAIAWQMNQWAIVVTKKDTEEEARILADLMKEDEPLYPEIGI